ncbi:hypothetical protein AADG42_00595 [Ammonicoccus fulvus]|uniref:Lipoprotein n=1 Tax=Ammonicoccus fulvus TaxID=3138240 RepID=A0ABZ3FIL3_9ACTN
MRRALATLSALALPLTLTACGTSIPGLPGSGSGFGAALNRLEIGSRDQILTVGYADVARVRELFGDYPAAPATDPSQRNARDAWLMTLTGAPQAIQMPSPRSPLAQSEGSYFTHATASVRAYGGTQSNSSWTAGGAGMFDELAPKLSETYTVAGDTATLSTRDQVLSRSLPTTIRKDGDALITATPSDQGSPIKVTERVGDLKGCLGDPDLAVISAPFESRGGVALMGTAVTLHSTTSATAVHCVRAADGTDPNTLADQLRGRQGHDYTATNVSVSGQVVKVELTPTKDPLESARNTILSMPERVFPVF